MLFRDLRARDKAARTREERFLSRTSLLALTGFLLSGIFDYTYGHSLGIILLSFVVFSPLLPAGANARAMAAGPPASAIEPVCK
jgi:hypothetical protein